MTQAEVAKALGVSEASIRLYELGKRKPNPEVVERIAAAVGIDVQALREIEVESVRDALEVLFRLEDACGLTPRPDGTLGVDRTAEHAPSHREMGRDEAPARRGRDRRSGIRSLEEPGQVIALIRGEALGRVSEKSIKEQHAVGF